MERTPVDAATPRKSTASVARVVSDDLGIEGFVWNYYELAPGESFSTGYHTHLDQEEVFYVSRGRATFRTAAGPVTVDPGEAIRFGPGEYQHGFNDTDETVVAFAFGAPKAGSETRVACPACGERVAPDITWTDDREVRVFHCSACGELINRQT
jgi:uncharacterized cupin superfamily protein